MAIILEKRCLYEYINTRPLQGYDEQLFIEYEEAIIQAGVMMIGIKYMR